MDGSAKSKFAIWLVVIWSLMLLPPILLIATFFEETVGGMRRVAGFCNAIGVLRPWLRFTRFVNLIPWPPPDLHAGKADHPERFDPSAR